MITTSLFLSGKVCDCSMWHQDQLQSDRVQIVCLRSGTIKFSRSYFVLAGKQCWFLLVDRTRITWCRQFVMTEKTLCYSLGNSIACQDPLGILPHFCVCVFVCQWVCIIISCRYNSTVLVETAEVCLLERPIVTSLCSRKFLSSLLHCKPLSFFPSFLLCFLLSVFLSFLLSFSYSFCLSFFLLSVSYLLTYLLQKKLISSACLPHSLAGV